KLITKPKNKNECILINLQDSDDGDGTHHVGIFKKGKDIRYYDSFGGEVPKEIRDNYKGYKIHNFQSYDGSYPDKPHQKYGDVICGELSVLFLMLCQKGYSFDNIIEYINAGQ